MESLLWNGHCWNYNSNCLCCVFFCFWIMGNHHKKGLGHNCFLRLPDLLSLRSYLYHCDSSSVRNIVKVYIQQTMIFYFKLLSHFKIQSINVCAQLLSLEKWFKICYVYVKKSSFFSIQATLSFALWMPWSMLT